MIYEDVPLSLRVLRDMLSTDVERVLVDSKVDFTMMLDFASTYIPNAELILEHYKECHPIFDLHDIEDEIKKALLSLDTTLEDTRNRLAEITEVQREIESIQKQKGLLQTEILSNQKFITKIQKEIEELKIEQNVSSNVHERIEESEDTLEILHQKHKTLVDQAHYFDIASTLLRDQGRLDEDNGIKI